MQWQLGGKKTAAINTHTHINNYICKHIMHISTTCAIILLQQLLVDLHSDSPNMRFDMTASQ